jgi:hypothetical protein
MIFLFYPIKIINLTQDSSLYPLYSKQSGSKHLSAYGAKESVTSAVRNQPPDPPVLSQRFSSLVNTTVRRSYLFSKNLCSNVYFFPLAIQVRKDLRSVL